MLACIRHRATFSCSDSAVTPKSAVISKCTQRFATATARQCCINRRRITRKRVNHERVGSRAGLLAGCTSPGLHLLSTEIFNLESKDIGALAFGSVMAGSLVLGPWRIPFPADFVHVRMLGSFDFHTL